jgi:hypothetical protein
VVAPPVVRWRCAFLSDAGPGSPVTRAVLLYLSTEMRPDGSKCFPSYATIGKALKMDPRTVGEHVRRAVADGWLDVTQRTGGKGGRFNLYLPRVPAAVRADDLHDEQRGDAGDEQRGGAEPRGEPGNEQRVGPGAHRVGPHAERVGPGAQRVGGQPSDLVVTGLVPGSYQSAHTREVRTTTDAKGRRWRTEVSRASTEPPTPAEVPNFDPVELFERMDNIQRLTATMILRASNALGERESIEPRHLDLLPSETLLDYMQQLDRVQRVAV